MGDRVIVAFKDLAGFAPSVYLHWHGHEAADLIKAAAPRMRQGDSGYSAARFAGHCHAEISGNTGLGLLAAPEPGEDGTIDWSEYSHGDNGVFVVDTETGRVEHFEGYDHPDGFTIALTA